MWRQAVQFQDSRPTPYLTPACAAPCLSAVDVHVWHGLCSTPPPRSVPRFSRPGNGAGCWVLRACDTLRARCRNDWRRGLSWPWHQDFRISSPSYVLSLARSLASTEWMPRVDDRLPAERAVRATSHTKANPPLLSSLTASSLFLSVCACVQYSRARAWPCVCVCSDGGWYGKRETDSVPSSPPLPHCLHLSLPSGLLETPTPAWVWREGAVPAQERRGREPVVAAQPSTRCACVCVRGSCAHG